MSQNLGDYQNDWFDRGRPLWVDALWILVSLFVSSTLPGSSVRVFLLRRFGAEIDQGVVIKPRVRIKFPWRLAIGRNSWIGEGAWIDNLADVKIGQDCCVSQGVYICTGNHDWSQPSFDLKVEPVILEDGCWLGAFSKIAPGVTIQRSAVVAMGAIVFSDVDENMVVSGNPASVLKSRNA